MASNRLEEAALAARERLIASNSYNNADDANNYCSTHTRALSDNKTPEAGKGTGVFLDTFNGGTETDINGNPAVVGSGRKGNIVINQYNKDIQYEHPDTSGNIGQIII